MAKSNYKTKPFAEWTEADFQAAEADRFAAWAEQRKQMRAELEREQAEQEAAEKQEA